MISHRRESKTVFYKDYGLTHVQNSRGHVQSFNLVLDMLTSWVENPQSTFYLSEKNASLHFY